MAKVEIYNNTNSVLFLASDDLKISRRLGKDEMTLLDEKIVEEMIFEPGIKSLIQNGGLIIRPVDPQSEVFSRIENVAEAPEKVFHTEAEILSQLKGNIKDFKMFLKSASAATAERIADVAIQNNISNHEIAELIKERTKIDIIKQISLKKTNK